MKFIKSIILSIFTLFFFLITYEYIVIKRSISCIYFDQNGMNDFDDKMIFFGLLMLSFIVNFFLAFFIKKTFFIKSILCFIITIIIFSYPIYQEILNKNNDTTNIELISICKKMKWIDKSYQGYKVDSISLKEYKIISEMNSVFPIISENAKNISFMYSSELLLGDYVFEVEYFLQNEVPPDEISINEERYEEKRTSTRLENGMVVVQHTKGLL